MPYQMQFNDLELQQQRPRNHSSLYATHSIIEKSEINSEYIIDGLRVPQSDLEQIRAYY